MQKAHGSCMKSPGDIVAAFWVVVIVCAILIGRILILLPIAVFAVIFVGSALACALVADSINWLWEKITA